MTLLPIEIQDESVLDNFMKALEVAGIQFKDKDEVAEEGNFLDGDSDEDEKVEEDVKGNDPVRLYLRKMGSVEL